MGFWDVVGSVAKTAGNAAKNVGNMIESYGTEIKVYQEKLRNRPSEELKRIVENDSGPKKIAAGKVLKERGES